MHNHWIIFVTILPVRSVWNKKSTVVVHFRRAQWLCIFIIPDHFSLSSQRHFYHPRGCAFLFFYHPRPICRVGMDTRQRVVFASPVTAGNKSGVVLTSPHFTTQFKKNSDAGFRESHVTLEVGSEFERGACCISPRTVRANRQTKKG